MNTPPLCIGITLGDPAGIGPEVTASALRRSAIRRNGRFKLIGDAAVQKYFCGSYPHCEFINVKTPKPGRIHPGKPNAASAISSLKALQAGIDMIRKNEISALVTAPVCKETIGRFLPSFHGHTEFLADAFGVKEVGMMFVAGNFRTILVTRHIPLSQVSACINPSNIFTTIRLTHESLQNTFGIKNPVIAVCGLNPHAGEGGTLGQEELTAIIPAMKQAQKHAMNVEGPFAADTLFSPSITKKYDAVVAMYHDQGLIPAKTLYFKKLVNLTIGLPFIRTSPAHGTAFDIAGKNKADASSMDAAIQLAVRLSHKSVQARQS